MLLILRDLVRILDGLPRYLLVPVLCAVNLGDETYPGIIRGMDAPDRGLSVRYLFRF